MNAKIRTALIDSDGRRRAILSHSLSGEGMSVDPFADTLELTARWPSVDVLLASDEGDTIVRLLDEMAKAGLWIPVIAYAEAPAVDRVVDAVLSGAIDYIALPSSTDLTGAIGKALLRATGLSSLRLREAIARKLISQLTRREREVPGGVAGGHSNRAIAERLAISPRTVEIHRANMLSKLGVQHTSEAIRIAIEGSFAAEYPPPPQQLRKAG